MSADGQFEAAGDAADSFNVVDFNIEVTDSSGVATSQLITLTDNVGGSEFASVDDIIDAINAEIGGGALNGLVSAGLQGARLVLAGLDDDVKSVRVIGHFGRYWP